MRSIFLAMIGAGVMTLNSVAQKATDQYDNMKDCPMHEQHQSATTSGDHAKHDMKERGDQGMGFAQGQTTHHFLLHKDGGAIQVTANSTSDKASIDEIQMHLQHIARAFQSGDFNIPMFVHDQRPPGVPMMTKLRSRIKYRYEAAENGGRVVISSENAEAVQAIHEFLKFQIAEHQTGDGMEAK
ncbi:MAG: hypothetical protein WA738_19610 [Candidatus Angelobacter sp.]